MTIDNAVLLLRKEYERAKKLEYVHNPLAYAIYKVWRKEDENKK